MNRKIYKKIDTVEVIVEKKAIDFDRLKLEEDIMNLYSTIENWKNLIELEIGYMPVAEFEKCPDYTMLKILIKHDLRDDEEEILERLEVDRSNRVEEWLVYIKMVLKRKNPLRNIDLILERLKTPLTPEEKNRVRDFLKEDINYIEI